MGYDDVEEVDLGTGEEVVHVESDEDVDYV